MGGGNHKWVARGLTLKTPSLVDLGVSTLGLNWLLFEVDACFQNSSHSLSKNCKASFSFEKNQLSMNFIEMRAWSLWVSYKHSCISVMLESFLWLTKLQIQSWVATYFILDELNLIRISHHPLLYFGWNFNQRFLSV